MTMAKANLITIQTALVSCDETSTTVVDLQNELENLYKRNFSNVTSKVFIENLNCFNTSEKSFEHSILFSRPISVRLQISFASVFFDDLKSKNFHLTPRVLIDGERSFNLSSITWRNLPQSNACSTDSFVEEKLCPMNSTRPICDLFSNPWNFTCSVDRSMKIDSFNSTTSEKNSLLPAASLNSWQIGLICISSIFIFCLLVFLLGYFYRRFIHSKQLTLSRTNLFQEFLSIRKASPCVAPKPMEKTATSWIDVPIDYFPSKENVYPRAIDENLSDEDAWMPILDIVYAELARLDEQDRIKTSM